MIANPNDPRAERCGHNFPPQECPYEHCRLRELEASTRDLRDALKAAKEALHQVEALDDGEVAYWWDLAPRSAMVLVVAAIDTIAAALGEK